MNIPARFDVEFLAWFREMTERAWADYQPRDFLAGAVGGFDFQAGTKWLGAQTDAEISQAEQRWRVQFPPDYRLFLRHLHCLDRPMKGAVYIDGSRKVPKEKPGCRNWLTDGEALRQAFDWPLEGLYFDLEHSDLWFDSWGEKPTDLLEQKSKVSKLVAAAPPLIPIFGHRYLLGTPCTEGNPVLSVYQSDIIFYGPDLRRYLCVEFATLLGLDLENELDKATAENPHRPEDIPFWGEFLTWASS